jgi:hypothetical protein
MDDMIGFGGSKTGLVVVVIMGPCCYCCCYWDHDPLIGKFQDGYHHPPQEDQKQDIGELGDLSNATPNGLELGFGQEEFLHQGSDLSGQRTLFQNIVEGFKDVVKGIMNAFGHFGKAFAARIFGKHRDFRCQAAVQEE